MFLFHHQNQIVIKVKNILQRESFPKKQQNSVLNKQCEAKFWFQFHCSIIFRNKQTKEKKWKKWSYMDRYSVKIRQCRKLLLLLFSNIDFLFIVHFFLMKFSIEWFFSTTTTTEEYSVLMMILIIFEKYLCSLFR